MQDDRAFLDAIQEHPEDDLHRLAWADWLEENGAAERAAFVRAQLRQAALEESDPAYDAAEDEADDLLAAHETHWLGPLANWCLEWRWQRGCVESVTVWADTLLAEGEELFRLAPIRALRLLAEPQDLPRLAGCSYLRRVEVLELSAGRTEQSNIAGPYHRDRPLQALFVSPHWHNLHRLDLRGQGIEGPALQTLIDTGLLARLTHLDLGGNHALGDRAVGILTGTRARRLEGLRLEDCNLTAFGLRQLLHTHSWPALRRLVVNYKPLFARSTQPEVALGELLDAPVVRRSRALLLNEIPLNRRRLEQVVASGILAGLEDLRLCGCQIDAESAGLLAAVADLCGLRRLELAGNGMRDRGAKALAASPHLGRLIRLGMEDNLIGGPGLRALLNAPVLAGLRDLGLGGNFVGVAGAEALVSRPRRLVRLGLGQANLDAEAAALLVGAPSLSRLRVLHLNANRLGDDGVKALTRSPHLRRLVELSLDSNGLDSPGAEALLESTTLDRVMRLSLRNAFITARERERLRGRFGPGTTF